MNFKEKLQNIAKQKKRALMHPSTEEKEDTIVEEISTEKNEKAEESDDVESAKNEKEDVESAKNEKEESLIKQGLDELKCNICLSYPIQYRESSCCNNTFCVRCSQKYIEKNEKKNKSSVCPYCRADDFTMESLNVNYRIQKILNERLMQCEHCGSDVQIGNIMEHYSLCEKNSEEHKQTAKNVLGKRKLNYEIQKMQQLKKQNKLDENAVIEEPQMSDESNIESDDSDDSLSGFNTFNDSLSDDDDDDELMVNLNNAIQSTDDIARSRRRLMLAALEGEENVSIFKKQREREKIPENKYNQLYAQEFNCI